jgi:hypothetical protein
VRSRHNATAARCSSMAITRQSFGSSVHTAFRNSVTFADHPFHLSLRLSDPAWLQRSAHPADISSKVNELSLLLQGANVKIISAHDEIKPFILKIKFWRMRVEKSHRLFSKINPLKKKLVHILFNNPVRTSKRTPHFTITKINWLTLFNPLKTKLV